MKKIILIFLLCPIFLYAQNPPVGGSTRTNTSEIKNKIQVDSGYSQIAGPHTINLQGVYLAQISNASPGSGHGFQVDLTANGTDATGDVYYRTSNGPMGRLALGATNTVIQSNGTLPVYGPVVTSGSYTPSLTNTTNVSSSANTQATYVQIGNVVTVTVVVSLQPTSANTLTTLTFSLPVSTSTTTQTLVVSGNFLPNDSFSNTAIGIMGSVVSGTTATMNFENGSITTTGAATVTFQYHIN